MKRFLFGAAVLLAALPVAAKPAMWVVRDADTEVTLYGTIHALPPGLDWLSPAATRQLEAAGSLVVEAVIPEDRFALAPIVAQLGIRDGLKPLTARVPKPLASRIAMTAAAAGVPLLALNRMETWLAAITLSEGALTRAGITTASGVEPALSARAKAEGKPIVGLETVEQQLRFFDALPEADQAALLSATVDEAGGIKAEAMKLVTLWRAGDVETIARDFSKEARASPTLTRVLLTDRNARWATWIAGVLRQPGKVFVAVGAGHFGGPGGLVALLKAKGLTVERVE